MRSSSTVLLIVWGLLLGCGTEAPNSTESPSTPSLAQAPAEGPTPVTPTTAGAHSATDEASLKELERTLNERKELLQKQPTPVAAPRGADSARPTGGQGARLLEVDLSDDRVRDLSPQQLWNLGVERLGWPRDRPANLSKDELHHRLLDAKYRHVGDFDDLDG